MRKILCAITVLFVWSCNQPGAESELSGTLAGAYTLQSIPNSSLVTSSPVLIYTDKYYIYANTAPDSTANFGFGSYLNTDSTIIEKNIFNSNSLDSSFEKKMRISRSPSTLTQIQEAPHGVSQTFKKMPGSKSSELDGAWELVRFENITGTDTSIIKNNQYKVYQNGHLLWVHRYPSTSINKQFQTGYGFGVFNIKGNTITETITSSNYKEIIEAPVTVSFSLIGKDQLLLESGDGMSITKETYRRVN